MASYPALMQLLRLLGRADALAALGVPAEPEPSALSAEALARLSALLDQRLEGVAAELAQEAAVSDDVGDAASGRAWIDERISGFGDLLTRDQAERLRGAALRIVAGWG